jgi:Right handed beta helix region
VHTRLVAAVITVAAQLLLGVSPALAQAAHTWVSAEGSDANTGTRGQPFATFNTAVANTAAGGTVSVVDPGDYGAVTISKAITIDGGGVQGSITFTGTVGIYVTAGASDTVILRNLTINGIGQGSDAIYLSSGATLVVENCALMGFTGLGIGVSSSAAQNVVVRKTSIVGGPLGVRVFQGAGPTSVVLQDVTITGATSAAIFTRSGVLEVSNSTLFGNAVALENDTSARIDASNNMISQNQTAVLVYTGSATHIANNQFMNNNVVLSIAGGSVISFGNNMRGGNSVLGTPTSIISGL